MNNETFSIKVIGFLSSLSGPYAYATILGVLLACGLGLPVPEDVTLISAGILSSVGSISFIGAMLVGYFGVLAGDTFLFFAGRRYGRKVFKLRLFRRIFTPDRLEVAEKRIQQNGAMICFFARFLPGLRAPIYLTAGVMKVRPTVFFLQDGLAALISVPVWVYVGHWFGDNIDGALHIAKELQFYILSAVAVGVLVWILYARRKRRSLHPTSPASANSSSHSTPR